MKAQISDDVSIIEPIFNQLKKNVYSEEVRNIENRKMHLQRLQDGYMAMKEQISTALKEDLGYNDFISEFAAHVTVQGQIKHLAKGFEEWAKGKSVPTPLGMGMASSSIKPEPLGVVLVISAWNYPLYTALPPLAAAISAGNCVILKPSELAPRSSNVLKKLFDLYMDKKYFRVIEGKAQVGKALSNLKFDKICFTGSTFTGRLVAMSAAKNLTPVLLQLGGKCPVIVDDSAKIDNAVLRILWGKFFNCGQTCVGVDHVYIHQSLKNQFKTCLQQKLKEFYEGDQNLMEDGNYPKVINEGHFERILKLLNDKHQGTVIYGGNYIKDKRFIAPTVIQNPKKESLMMKEQIFGPILPLFYYTDLKQVVNEINNREKPLAVYHFSENSKNIQYVNENTSSGAFVVNDNVIQTVNPDLPFGGVGGSGQGRYHGESGFLAFSNEKSVVKTQAKNHYPSNQRFPPYTESKKATMLKLLKFGSITYSQIGKFFIIVAILILVITLGAVFIPKLVN